MPVYKMFLKQSRKIFNIKILRRDYLIDFTAPNDKFILIINDTPFLRRK